jgi:acyl-coenzyme A synthetase/AMP-(fatty) acid ligase
VVLVPDAEGTMHEVIVEELVVWVRRSLGSLKTPSHIEVRDELPTTATGKVLRRVVRDELSGPTPT